MSKKNIEQNSALIWLHWIGIVYVSLMTMALVAATGAAMLGVFPWLDIVVNTSRGALQMGPNIQIAAAALALVLTIYLPSSLRVLKLEAAHRDFNLTMGDVSKAYIESHKADRAGLFNLSSEFDSIRERINHMRNHPELSKLEPGVLDAAAQMSHVSRDLATVYSDEHVTRAKSILRQRQVELEEFSDQLALARRQTDEIKRWTSQLEVEGSVADNQLAQLKQDLGDILPTLGLKVIKGPKTSAKAGLEAPAPKAIEAKETPAALPEPNVVDMALDKAGKTKLKPKVVSSGKDSAAAE